MKGTVPDVSVCCNREAPLHAEPCIQHRGAFDLLPLCALCDLCGDLLKNQGRTNRSVMRSDSPIARYFE